MKEALMMNVYHYINMLLILYDVYVMDIVVVEYVTNSTNDTTDVNCMPTFEH